MDANYWQDSDYRTLVAMSGACRFSVEDCLAVMAYESGLANKPSTWIRRGTGTFALNKDGGARGLNQMMPDTLKNLGWKPGNPDYDEAKGEYNQAPCSVQVVYAARYFEYWRNRFDLASWDSAGDLYIANFMPAHLPWKNVPSHVLISEDKWPEGYRVNKGLDFEKKGWITVGNMNSAASRGRNTAEWKTAMVSVNKLLQTDMNKLGLGPLVVDGIIGPKTLLAAKGPITWQLRAELQKRASASP